jgi:hypothetical protein
MISSDVSPLWKTGKDIAALLNTTCHDIGMLWINAGANLLAELY